MWPSWAAVKQDDAKAARGGRFLLVHSVGLEARADPVVLEDLLVVEMNPRVWNHPVLRPFRALLALMGGRNRVPGRV
jgi:hypothetical protein